MAITRSLIFTSFDIADAGGANPASFDKTLVESIEVTLTPTESMIDDGQTLSDFYDVEWAINLYEASVLADARVYTDASDEPVKSDITFSGSTGATDLDIAGTIANGTRVFDGNRVQARVYGSKRGVSVDLVAVTNVA